MTPKTTSQRLAEREAKQKRELAAERVKARATYWNAVLAAYEGEAPTDAETEELAAALELLGVAPERLDYDVGLLAMIRQTRKECSVEKARERLAEAEAALTPAHERAVALRAEADAIERAALNDKAAAHGALRDTIARLRYANDEAEKLRRRGCNEVPPELRPVEVTKAPHRVIETCILDNVMHKPGAIVQWPVGEEHPCLRPIPPDQLDEEWVPPPPPPIPNAASLRAKLGVADVEALVAGVPPREGTAPRSAR